MTGAERTCRRTLPEIGSTCLKAARGAGCHWGLAEEAGMAARVLESIGFSGSECLAALLSSDRACPCTGTQSGPLCGIAAAAKLSDRIHDLPTDGKLEMGEIIGPLLLAAPLVLAARRSGVSYLLTIGGRALRIGSDGVEGDIGDLDLHATPMSASVAKSKPPSRAISATSASREISAPAWKALEMLAAKTLVPESEQSRSSGAGPD